MNPRGRNVAIAAATLALVALVVVWWNATFEHARRSVDLPPRGEPTYNPLYALKIALRRDGVRVNSRQRLQLQRVALGRDDTVLILSDPRTLADADVDALLKWTTGGGHLVVGAPLGEGDDGRLFKALDLYAEPERPACVRVTTAAVIAATPTSRPKKITPALTCPGTTGDAITDALAATPAEQAKTADAQPSDPAPDRRDESVLCPAAQFGIGDVEPLWAWGHDDDSGYSYARLAHGDGTVDVLGDLGFLGNDSLDKGINAVLARQLLSPGWRKGVVHLVYDASLPPLWRLLLDHAWMVWLPLLVGFALWLWMRTQRFGPLAPAPEPDRRALLEHVQASGEHLWRYGRGDLLHAAVRDAFFARLRRRDPLAAALDGAAQAQAIAARTGSTAADVTAALQPPQRLDARDFHARISRLLQLRQRL